MTLNDRLHGVEFGGIGIIKSPLSLAQKFIRFPKSTDFAAVAIAIANPEPPSRMELLCSGRFHYFSPHSSGWL